GTGGTFEVVQEEWVGGPLSLSADELAKAVERRRKEWAAVVDQLGSLDEPLVIASDLPNGTDQIVIRTEQWRLLSFLDGRRSVHRRRAVPPAFARCARRRERSNASASVGRRLMVGGPDGGGTADAERGGSPVLGDPASARARQADARARRDPRRRRLHHAGAA